MRYRKPRTFNWVTFVLLGMAGIAVYVTIYLWPIYSLHSRAKGVLLDNVPAFYKANLMPDEVARAAMEEIQKDIRTALKRMGVNDKAAKVYLRRGQKEIELEVRFKAYAHFPWPDKTFEFDLAPKVVTDATRVDW
jgi:hypothetical protein